MSLVASASRAVRPAITRSSPLCRRYADNASKNNEEDNRDDDSGGFMRAMATRLEAGPIKPPTAFNIKQLTKALKSKPSPIRENFVPFIPSTAYNPYDFEPDNRLSKQKRTFVDPAGPSRAIAVRQDVFHQLEIDPLDEVLNCGLLTQYTTDMGRIRTRKDTKLTRKNQRKIGKAIRRARAMGLISAFTKWDERLIKS